MKRMERIFAYVEAESAKFTKETLHERGGLDAQEIADALGIAAEDIRARLRMSYL